MANTRRLLRTFLVVLVVGAGLGLAIGPGAEILDRAVTAVSDAAEETVGGPEDAEPTPTTATASTARARIELAVHERVNEARRDRGIDALEFDTDLRSIARSHSEDMARDGYFSHTSPEGDTFADRYDRFDYRCRVPTGPLSYASGGENLFTISSARGLAAAELADRAVTGWLDSPGHRRNLLDPDWRREGIGVATADDGRVYITQNFC